jgi:3-methylcrotonyl-CoA carboxylase alpha subunit
MVTGLDLVEWQLEVAAGNPIPLTQQEIPLVGHAFEARIYAENPRNNFLPDGGKLLYLSTPEPTHTFAPSFTSGTAPVSSGQDFLPYTPEFATAISPSVRLEEGFTQGSEIGVFYDPMIAKLVVHGGDRTEALRVLRKALDEYHVVGVSTNIEFLRTLAGNQSFIDAEVETGFIPVSLPDLKYSQPYLKSCDRNTSMSYSLLPPSPLQNFLHKQVCLLHFAITQRRPPLHHGTL